jgi:hypothetical protein
MIANLHGDFCYGPDWSNRDSGGHADDIETLLVTKKRAGPAADPFPFPTPGMLLPGGAGTTVADQDHADRRPLDAEVSALSPWTVMDRDSSPSVAPRARKRRSRLQLAMQMRAAPYMI